MGQFNKICDDHRPVGSQAYSADAADEDPGYTGTGVHGYIAGYGDAADPGYTGMGVHGYIAGYGDAADRGSGTGSATGMNPKLYVVS